MWLGVPFLCARILHLSLLNFDHVTSFVLWMWVWSVCPFRAETFNSYFVVYPLCILPQPWNNIWDRECSIHTGPPVRRTWNKTAVNPHWKCSISKIQVSVDESQWDFSGWSTSQPMLSLLSWLTARWQILLWTKMLPVISVNKRRCLLSSHQPL